MTGDKCGCGAEKVDGWIVGRECRIACPGCGRHTAWFPDMVKALAAWRQGKRKEKANEGND